MKTHHKIDGKFSRQRCLDPVFKKCMHPDPDPACPERLDPDLVCPERLDPDPDPINIRPDPQPCWQVRCLWSDQAQSHMKMNIYTMKNLFITNISNQTVTVAIIENTFFSAFLFQNCKKSIKLVLIAYSMCLLLSYLTHVCVHVCMYLHVNV